MSPAPGRQPFGRHVRHRRGSSGSWFLSAAPATASTASQEHLPSAMAYEALGLPSGANARSVSAGIGAPLGSMATDPQGKGSDAPPSQGSQQQVQAVVQKAELSLKVVVAAGTACAFHIGGSLESSIDDSSGVPVRGKSRELLALQLPSAARSVDGCQGSACELDPHVAALLLLCRGGSFSSATRHSQRKTRTGSRGRPLRSCGRRSSTPSQASPALCSLPGRLPAGP